MASIVKSLAGTNPLYVQGQGRIRDGSLHVQFAGGKGNRKYGFALDIPVDKVDIPKIVRVWRPSLAGTEKRYFTLQARPVMTASEVNVQIKGLRGNRVYGSAFRVKLETELFAWLYQQVYDYVAPQIIESRMEEAARQAEMDARAQVTKLLA